MGMEQANFPAAESPKELEAEGFIIKLRPAENPDYSYVQLEQAGITLKTVILNETAEVQTPIDLAIPNGITLQQKQELMQSAGQYRSKAADAIRLALGFETGVADPTSEETAEPDAFWTTPEAIRNAEAQVLARQRGDHRPDVQ